MNSGIVSPLPMMLAVSLGSLILAVILFKNPQILTGRTNYGHLIEPPIPVDRMEIVGFDEFSKKNIGEIRGRWVLVQIVASSGCNAVCQDSLHKTKQVRLMLGKDLMRVRRLAIVTAQADGSDVDNWWRGNDYLLRSKPVDRLQYVVRTLFGGPVPDGLVFLMDPMGNLMMWYEPGFDPYGMKNDLKKLLYVSQVG